jgi:hypothetical protein
MAKAAASKKTAKVAKAAAGGKKKAHRKGKETFNSYIHKVLKQVHPGACARTRADASLARARSPARARPTESSMRWWPPPPVRGSGARARAR